MAAPIPAVIAAIEKPVDRLMKYYAFKALQGTVVYPVMLLVLYFRYHTMRYRFDEEGIHMRWGILFRHEILLNYSRIQDIQLESNFLERWMGLSRIVIQTAAGGEGGDMVLEGIEDAPGMRDFLYSRMRGAKHPEEAKDDLAATLRLIAAEMKAIREAVERRSA